MTLQPHWPEITDRIVAFDPATLRRLPVRRSDVIDEFESLGDRRAVQIVRKLPVDDDGVLDPGHVDALLLDVHREMQILSEEFFHGLRMQRLLKPLVKTVRDSGASPVTALDIGCGSGFVIRWLGAFAKLPEDVRLMGADFNPALIAEATRLAALENLRCEFRVANASTMEHPATIQFSTGILHHFRGEQLQQLLAGHDREGVHAFFHFDFQPSPFAPFGAWLFHKVRMRLPISRHDGCLSAARAHPADTLLQAAKQAAPGFKVSMFSTHLNPLPLPRVFHVLLGVREEHVSAFERNLGGLRGRLGGWQ